MRAEKYVAWQFLKDRKATFVVRGDLWIDLVADQLVARVDVGAADDHDVQKTTALGLVKGPGSGSPGVAGRKVRRENGATQTDRVAVVKDSIDVRGRVAIGLLSAVLEVCSAARFDDRNVASHYVILGAGEMDDLRAACAMIAVRVTDEQDFDVAEVEAERFDAFSDQRYRGFEVRIDEDKPARRGDEIRAEIFAADVIEISCDVEGRERSRPRRIALGNERGCGSENRE